LQVAAAVFKGVERTEDGKIQVRPPGSASPVHCPGGIAELAKGGAGKGLLVEIGDIVGFLTGPAGISYRDARHEVGADGQAESVRAGDAVGVAEQKREREAAVQAAPAARGFRNDPALLEESAALSKRQFVVTRNVKTMPRIELRHRTVRFPVGRVLHLRETPVQLVGGVGLAISVVVDRLRKRIIKAKADAAAEAAFERGCASVIDGVVVSLPKYVDVARGGVRPPQILHRGGK